MPRSGQAQPDAGSTGAGYPFSAGLGRPRRFDGLPCQGAIDSKSTVKTIWQDRASGATVRIRTEGTPHRAPAVTRAVLAPIGDQPPHRQLGGQGPLQDELLEPALLDPPPLMNITLLSSCPVFMLPHAGQAKLPPSCR